MRLALALPLLAVVAACSDPEPTPEPTPTATVAAPRTLVAADLDLTSLGAKIVGPQGPQVETDLSAANRMVGQMTSFVACPKDAQECVPGSMPEGTLYTYVHRVTLAEADAAPEQPTEGGE